MENQIFRKKTLERITSPEQLNDYMRVVGPAPWVILIAVIVLLVSLLVWTGVVAIESTALGTAVVEDGVMTIHFADEASSQQVSVGAEAYVGAVGTPIEFVGQDEAGNVIAGAKTALPDGEYEAQVIYDSLRLLELIWE